MVGIWEWLQPWFVNLGDKLGSISLSSLVTCFFALEALLSLLDRLPRKGAEKLADKPSENRGWASGCRVAIYVVVVTGVMAKRSLV